MNIGITHLAFNSQEDLLNEVKELNVSNIELVFSKMEDEDKLIQALSDLGITTTTSQSILFGSSVEDFLDSNMIEHIKKVSVIGNRFGVKTLVLGSPKQRKIFDRLALIERFREIDSIMRESNQILCIEPNCKKYGGSYFFTVSEIVEFIVDGKFTNIKTMIDTHNILNENQYPSVELENNLEYIHHIHVSEDGLEPYSDSIHHELLSNAIKRTKYNKTITYEVLPTKKLKESFKQLNKTYK